MLGLISYALILATLSVGAWVRPAIGVAAVLCLFGLKQWGQSSTAFVAQHGQFTNYAIGVIALVAVIRAASMRSCVFCRTPLAAWLIAALLTYALFSAVWAPDVQAALTQWNSQGPYIITITLLTPLLLNDFEEARTAFFWTALSGAAICILALLFGRWGFRGLLLFADTSENETNPLALSSMAGTVFIISAVTLAKSKQPIARILCLVFIPVALAVVLRSGSRGQLISSVAAVMLSLPIAFRLKDGRSIAGLVLAAAVIAGLSSGGASLVEIDASRWQGNDSENAVAGRIDSAKLLLSAAASNPLTMVFGLGNSSAFTVLGIYPHIAGLEVIAEEGIIGAALYFGIVFLALRSIKRLAARDDLSDTSRGALAILAALFVFEFLLSWKQGSLLSSFYVFAYAIALGKLEEAADGEVPAEEVAVTAALPRFQNLMR